MNKRLKKDIENAKTPRGSGRKANNLIAFSGSPSLAQPRVISDPSQGRIVVDPSVIADSIAQHEQEINTRYDQALSTSLDGLHQQGIYVTTDDGSLFIGPAPWPGGVPDGSRAWLPIQDIQQVENERGTAGTLLLHLQEPALAKDTAGHDSGSSTTWSGQQPTASTPIPEVQTLPPVTKTADGTVTLTEAPLNQLPTATLDPGTPLPTTTTTTGTTSQQSVSAGGKYWWLWYIAAAIVVIVYIKFYSKK
jgi:hypothetical protein